MTWDAQSLYGMGSAHPVVNPVNAAPTQHMAPDDDREWGVGMRALVNPRNPLFWVGALMAVTVGAAGLAGSVRLGPAKLSGSVGKS